MEQVPEGLIKPKAIIFDWDNTLIDSWVVLHDALNATFDDYGLDRWTLDETQARVAHSLRDSFPRLFGDEWERAGEVFYEHFEAIHLDRLTPINTAFAVLQEFQANGVYLGVVSNKTGRLLRLEAEKLGWDGLFAHIIGSTDAKSDKPAADPVIMALAGYSGEAGADVWFVGDAMIDMQCAFNSGCAAVLVCPKPPKRAEFGDFYPVHYTPDLATLPKLAKTL